jgi:Fur family ferric uptake transcriptional regulator
MPQKAALFQSPCEISGLATVYRVLTQFEEAGLVCRLQFVEGQSVFEMDRGVHHDHLICAKCGKIEEFVDETIEERQRIIAADNAFRLTDHRLLIYGICADCRNESDSDQAR